MPVDEVIRKYLGKYDRNEDRFFTFITSHGANAAIAAIILRRYAVDQHEFKDGDELDKTVLRETKEEHFTSVNDFFVKHAHYVINPKSKWQRLKERWTRKP